MRLKHKALLMPWAGGSSFSPPQLSGLQFWLKADAITGLNDGDPVTTWNDSSGSGRNATGVGAARPIYKTNIINGLPALQFSGAQIMSLAAIDLSATQGATLFCVSQQNTAALSILYEFSTNINSFTDAFVGYCDAAGLTTAALKGNVGTCTFASMDSYLTQWIVTSYVFDKSLTTQEARAWTGGISTGAFVNFNNTNNFGNRTSFIGARSGGTLPLTGYIAEMFLYNRALTTAERTQVEEYLG